MGAINVPLHTVYLHSDLVSGPVAVGLRPCLPVKGISLILGNDLAGNKVVVNPQVLEIPCKDTKWEQAKRFEGLFLSCMVTRAMAKATQIGTHTGKDDELTDEKLTPTESAGTSPGGTQDSSQSARTDAFQISMKPHTPGEPKESVENIMLSTQKLILDQDKDHKIRKLKQHSLDEKEASKVPVCYFVKDGVLMRKWRPPDVEAIPLTSIKAPNIVKALVMFFTFVGLPKVVQSDQGSNFMSGLFQQVMFQLGIRQIKSTAYHPQT